MTIKVSTISGSPNGWRVLLALAFKQLPYEVNYLQLSKMEHKSETYLVLNPRGKVPTLQVDGKVVRDSIAILAWLDREHPETAIFGANADEARTVWQTTMETAEYLRPAFQGVFTPILIRGVSYETSDATTRQQLEEAAQTLKDECRRLEQLVSNDPYMAGTLPSAADAVAFPEIQMMERARITKANEMKALGFDCFETEFPNISKWSDRVLARPGVVDTMPVHWAT